jgi:hypothetical protein
MPTEYQWYEVVTDQSLEQGDILEEFSIPVPISETGDVVEKFYNLIVITQSSDIAQDKTKYILLCPIWQREELEKVEPKFFASGRLKILEDYRMVGFYPIKECKILNFERPWRVVQFQRVFEVGRQAIMEHVARQPHLRLLTPYREHMSQHLARFFMRVSLPKKLELSYI